MGSPARASAHSTACSGSHGFSSERKFSIHKVPLEPYMSKLCVYFLIAPSAGLLIQPAIMWKTHTPTVLVDAAIVLSRRALPDKYRQLNPSSCSHRYPFSLMISVFSSSPHLFLTIPTYASLSLGWSPTHQVPCMRFHDCVFDTGRACAADVAISNAATAVKRTRVFIGYFGTRSYPVLRFVARAPRAQFRHRLALSMLVLPTSPSASDIAQVSARVSRARPGVQM